MDIRIVPGDISHIAETAVLEKQCFSRPWPQSMLESQLFSPRGLFFAALDRDDRVLGYIGMTTVLDEGSITNVAVDPGKRRQGIASGLLEALVKKGREMELAFITLEVRKSNAPAIALYEKYGFSTVGERKNYYDEPKEDALLMTLYL